MKEEGDGPTPVVRLSLEVIEVVRQMAGKFTDELIAATLNRVWAYAREMATRGISRGCTRCTNTRNSPPSTPIIRAGMWLP